MPKLQNDIVQQLAILQREVTTLLNQQLAAYQLNANNYFYVLKLLENPGVTQSDFDQLVKLNQSTVTRGVNGLVKSGYVLKVPGKDRRSQQLYLTPAGEKIARSVSHVIATINQELALQFKDQTTLEVIQQLQTQVATLKAD